jgi:peptide/nickel transport system permease protein
VGNLLVAAIYGADYNVAMAVLLVSVILTLIAYLLADILYTIADPRIRLR